MRALVTGATGFIGKRLCSKLEQPVVLTRNVDRARRQLGDGVTPQLWKPEDGPPPAAAFDGVDVVFHLAGESVAHGAWTEAKKARIRDSRVDGTRHLVEAIAALEHKPKAFVCASAIGWYGNRGDEELTEATALPGEDFLGGVCSAWEAEAKKAGRKGGPRTVSLRIGVVLGRGGGAMSKMLLPFKLCLGGTLGGGQQWMSWVHLDDLVDLMLFCAADDCTLEGPVNGTAPNPVINLDFTRELGRALQRPTLLPAPAGAMRFVLGEMADALLLGSARIYPDKATGAGFRFRYQTVDTALREVCSGLAPR